MKMKKFKSPIYIYIYRSLAPISLIPLTSLFTVSCANNNHSEIKNEVINQKAYIDIWEYLRDVYPKYVIDNKISEKTIELSNDIFISYYRNWIDSLSLSDWAKDANGVIENLYCTSERQAIALYGVCWGHFWNIYLHKNQIPPDQMVNRKFLNLGNLGNKQEFAIRGTDYKYIDQALFRAEVPRDLIVYHGVEFMENEFWDQLQQFITYNEKENKYDYSNCAGKEITSYGFLSTTTDKQIAVNFSNGFDWTQDVDTLKPPFKENMMFKIKLNKGQTGVGYISGFDIINGAYQGEAQFLIKTNSKFKIDKVYKENDVNVFEITMIS